MTKLNLTSLSEQLSPHPANKTVVRVTTSSWIDSSGLHTRKALRVMKRLSWGYIPMIEDVYDAESVMPVNLYSVEDGLYEVVLCNTLHDWETGMVEDFNLKLIPYKEGL